MNMHIHHSRDAVELGQQAAEHGANLIRQAIAQRGQAHVIVATGASQFQVLSHLVAAPDIRWDKVTAFHLDEYVGMDLTHPASFRLYLWQRFVSRLPLPLRAFHYVNGEGEVEQEVRRLGALIAAHPIDVAFVGIGENGHLAFNDPPADLVTQQPYIVVQLDQACRQQQLGEGWFANLEAVPTRAISMSVQQILKSRTLIVSVPDKRKALAVKNTLEQKVDAMYPSTALQLHSDVHLYLDPASASLLQA